MEVKIITCRRIFNLGNYESRHLEITANINVLDNPEQKATELIELVERKVSERVDLEIEADDLKDRIIQLRDELKQIEKQKAALTAVEPDPGDVPFESGDATNSSGIPDGF
ncbi:hypothetical protein [Nostoc sp. 'Peltigera membranacea cyanobiont' 232]|uniref:hypothetical protein n=1 Tax=Nostoc sp. 'Peltigera membranacea cyanobiont' 232 TaxID=2014531 RepID=UPI000B95AAD5|nr:hypothetical protein [Nostoc sp. 'Peltigera membranacea cyanobiont' 232]OYE04735.1 hypothetical protein CDG79_11385 [Nostoc sp. 'Peltigera membranacea cyanobiont' 232]